MRRRFLLAAVGLFAGGVTLAACDDPVGEGVIPVFAAEIVGAVSRLAAGGAMYGVVRDAGLTGFTVLLEDDTSNVTIVLQKPSLAKPLPGNYPIVPRDEVGGLGQFLATLRIVVDGVQQEYQAESGGLLISEETPAFLKGNFHFDAVRTSPCCDPEPVTVTVDGTFNARQGTVEAEP